MAGFICTKYCMFCSPFLDIVFLSFRAQMTHSVRQLLRREAAAEGQQEPGRPLNSNLPPEQSPHEIGFLAQKTKPGLAVRNHPQISCTRVALRYVQRLFADHDGCLQFLLPCEREVICSVQPFGSPALKYEGQPAQKTAN